MTKSSLIFVAAILCSLTATPALAGNCSIQSTADMKVHVSKKTWKGKWSNGGRKDDARVSLLKNGDATYKFKDKMRGGGWHTRTGKYTVRSKSLVKIQFDHDEESYLNLTWDSRNCSWVGKGRTSATYKFS